MVFKITILIVVAVIIFTVLIKKTNEFAERFRQYMLNQANKTFGTGVGWDKPWAIFLSKAMVVFFAIMGIVFFYVLIFSL